MPVQRDRLVAVAWAATGLLVAVALTSLAGAGHAAMPPPAQPAEEHGDTVVHSRGIDVDGQPHPPALHTPAPSAREGGAAGPAVATRSSPADEASPSAGSPATPTPSPGASADQAADPRWRWPAPGRVTSEFGPRWGRRHEGLDIAAAHGSPVVAAAGGRVTAARAMGGYGLVVKVAHPGATTTVYAHLSSLSVTAGQALTAGQRLGATGCSGSCTGAHLHFEVRRDGAATDPRGLLP